MLGAALHWRQVAPGSSMDSVHVRELELPSSGVRLRWSHPKIPYVVGWGFSLLAWMQKKMSERYEVKIRRKFGPHAKDAKLIKNLNRRVEESSGAQMGLIMNWISGTPGSSCVRWVSLNKDPQLQPHD